MSMGIVDLREFTTLFERVQKMEDLTMEKKKVKNGNKDQRKRTTTRSLPSPSTKRAKDFKGYLSTPS